MPAACTQARRAIAAFLGENGTAQDARSEEDDFRTHLVGCADCMALYREAVASAARLGNSMRENRSAVHKRRIREGMRERAAAATGDKRRKNRFGLRLALLPAGVALLILLVNGRAGDAELFIRWNGGEVLAAGQLMDQDRAVIKLEPGDWCETRGNAEAQVVVRPDGEEVRFALGPRTAILMEDPVASRIRLARGEVELRGPGVVLASHGVLEIENGRARLSVSGGTYDLDCLEGRLVWTGPRGARELSAGQSIDAGSILADSH